MSRRFWRRFWNWDWEDFLSLHLHPWGTYICRHRPFRISYRRTEKSHVVRLRISPDVRKEEIKARFVEPGIVEIEWPRKVRGEEIPVE